MNTTAKAPYPKPVPELDRVLEMLEEEGVAARTALSRINKDIRDLKLRIAKESWHVEPGVRVKMSKWVYTGVTITGTVVLVEFQYTLGGKPWVTIQADKQDGSPGKRRINCYKDWELIEDPDE